MIALQIAKELTPGALATDSINLFVPGNNYDTFIDEDLLIPSYLVPGKDGYYIGWIIDGYTHTQKGIEFKNDVLKKISLVLNAQIKPTPPKNIRNHYYTNNKYHLSELNDTLRDLRTSTKGLNLLHSGDDVAFNIIRAEAYKMKRESSLDYDLLLDFSLRVIPELNIKKKGFSDIKSKVKNIHNWTLNFYNAGTKKRVSVMTREEASLNARTIRMNNIKTTVFDYLKTLTSLGVEVSKLSISFISKSLSLSWATTKRYLSLFGILQDYRYFFKEHIPLIKQLKLIGTEDLKEVIINTVWFTPKEWFSLDEKGFFNTVAPPTNKKTV